MPRTKPTKVENAGVVIASGVRTAATDTKDGAIYLAKGTGFFARKIADAVSATAKDFGKGLKKGWERG